MEQAEAQRQQKLQAEEQRKQMLSVILEAEASERLHRIAMVRPEKARQVEDQLLQSFKMSGGRMPKVSEKQLIALLEGTEKQKTTKVTIQRKKGFDSDDDTNDSDDD